MTIRHQWGLAFFAAAITLLLTLASSANVRADDFQCMDSLGAITVTNLVVPENASCTLNGTIVDGNIFIQTNATLNAYDVQVNNNIQADNAASVNVYSGSSVSGNIQITGSGAADIQSVDIDNNLSFNENDNALNADNNTIGGNLQAFKNSGGVSIDGNSIGGNLQCKENAPPPTGSGNNVSGNMEDQCANFGGVPTPAPTYTLQSPTNTPQTPTNTPQSPSNTPQSPTNTPQAPTQTPVIDNEAPGVHWIAPVLAEERYDIGEGEQVILEAEASDNVSIQQVMFIRWDAVNLQYITMGSVDRAPYRININAGTLNPGWNQVFVNASDAAGNRSDSPFIWLYKLVEGNVSFLIFLPFTGK
jgi:hypothetical protein